MPVTRGGVRARNYVLHVNRSYAIGSRGDYLYLDTTGMDGGGATHCGRRAATVNCASTGCDYSPDELCRACRSRFFGKVGG